MKLRNAVLLTAACLTAACFNDTGPLGSTERTIHMQAGSFSPNAITVARGGRVTWVNDNAVAHDITPNNPQQPGAWTARKIAAQAGVEFTHTFTQSGTYDYHCTIHAPGMTGRIVVQ